VAKHCPTSFQTGQLSLAIVDGFIFIATASSANGTEG
jgi:hypothetical protein